MRFNNRSRLALFLFFAFFLALAETGLALPFNDDMVNNQLRPGLVMRSRPGNSVAFGSVRNHVENKDAAASLENPRKGVRLSELRGQRLFGVNCLPCHGDIRKTPYQPGKVAAKFMPPPDISGAFYREKSDGYIYGTIHFGGLAMMPALGWKLTPNEHWDIVNYIRQVQNSKK